MKFFGNIAGSLFSYSGCLAYECQAGYHNPTYGDTESACVGCAAGKNRLASSSTCTDCEAGTYSGLGSTSCTACDSGKLLVYSATADESQACSSCGTGEFADSSQSSCTQCPPGKYLTNAFAAVEDSACTGCTSGKFSTATAAMSDATCLDCNAGEYSTPSSTSCSNCQPGKHSGTSSSSCTGCVSGKYLVNPATHIGGDACTICTQGTYADTEASASCTVCPAGRYNDDGATSPNEHLSCPICTAGKYNADQGTDSALHVSCQACLPGKYNADNGVNVLVHDDVGGCNLCDVGKFSDDANGATSCQSCVSGLISGAGASSCSTCPVGYKCIEGIVESTCPAGKYSNGGTVGCVECIPKYKCPGGTDKIPCPPGSYSASASQTECTNCEAGKFQSDEAKDSCNECQAGHFCLASSTQEITCQSGSMFQTEKSQTSCLTCSLCPIGSVASAPCTITSDTTCVPCLAAEYTNDGITCKRCETEGQYSDKDGSFTCKTARAGHKPTSDRKSEEQCQAGRYSPGAAEECSECGEGKMSEAGAAGCSTCATCAVGRYLISNCTTTTGTQCGDCLAGTASMGGMVTECISCLSDGQYSDKDGASYCQTAPAGAKPTDDRAKTEACPTNTFSIGGSDTCDPCPQGAHSMPGSTACDRCSSGTYFDEPNNSCKPCPKNTFTISGATDISGCESCAAGAYAPEGAGYCQVCPQYMEYSEVKGKCICLASFTSFSNSENDTFCSCKAGETLMGTTCGLCEKGKWKGGIGVESCSRCEETLKGSISVEEGSTAPTTCVCPKGTYDDGECIPVVEGMRDDVVGMTLETVFVEEGFWRTGPNSSDVRECPVFESCRGGKLNKTGSTNILCLQGHSGPVRYDGERSDDL